MKLQEVILAPDTRANQPLATDVPPGTLYSVTDEDNLVERSDGADWVRYVAGVPSSGIARSVLNVQSSATGIGNGADMSDDSLFTYSVPANTLALNGDSLRIVATGHCAANANDKAVKFWFAGTAVLIGGAPSPLNGVDWVYELEVVRIDATHVSARWEHRIYGEAGRLLLLPSLSVFDLAANATVVMLTGSSPTAGAADDVLGYLMKTVLET